MSQILSNTSNLQRALELLSNKAAGSGGTENEDAIVNGTISSYTNDRVTSIGSYAFYFCSRLTTVSFPAATSIGSHAFLGCSRLTTVSFPAATSISNSAFNGCSRLTTVSFPAATSIGSYAFAFCSGLTTVSFPAATSISSYAFAFCSSLTTVNFPAATSIGSYAFSCCYSLTTASFPAATSIGRYAFACCSSLTEFNLTGSSLCSLANSNAFSKAGITSTTGTIYVPASLLTSYQTATNWAYFSTQFVGVNVGDSGDSGEAELITFTIEGTTYQAEEGMTWGQWVESDYNTGGYSISAGYIADSDLELYVYIDPFTLTSATDTIISGNSYLLNY